MKFPEKFKDFSAFVQVWKECSGIIVSSTETPPWLSVFALQMTRTTSDTKILFQGVNYFSLIQY